MISAGPNGEPGNDSSAVVTLSDDGWAVAFVSYASNLVTGDLNGLPDVFVRNLRTWEIERVPFDDDRTSIQNLAVSGNGEVVIFLAQFVGFASGMFKYDTRTGALTELTAVETQPQNNLAATDYFGRPVLFDTSDSLDPNDPGGRDAQQHGHRHHDLGHESRRRFPGLRHCRRSQPGATLPWSRTGKVPSSI